MMTITLHNKMANTLCYVVLLSIISLMMAKIESKDVTFCMPPVASFTQTLKYVSYYGEIRNTAYRLNIQYDVKLNKQRTDTYSLDGSLTSSEFTLADSHNNTIVYTVKDGSCYCVNQGNDNPGTVVWAQCITKPILAKETIAEQPVLKVGYNGTNSKWTNDDYYWIAPSKENGYWWFLSKVNYVISGHDIELGSSTFYDHSTTVNYSSMVVPKDCPSMETCPHPRR